MDTRSGFKTVDEYIASFPKETQDTLSQVRETIKAVVPEADEKISYGIPTLMLNGRMLIYFAGWKKHFSIYPIPSGDEAFNEKIKPFISGKGTLKFPLDKPVPVKLIEEMVRLRMMDAGS